MNSKLEAISHLESAFANNKAFKKKWTDYIEMCIIEAFEENAGKVLDGVSNYQLAVAKAAQEKIIDLFNTDWWKLQGT
jgi:hypothetical protein